MVSRETERKFGVLKPLPDMFSLFGLPLIGVEASEKTLAGEEPTLRRVGVGKDPVDTGDEEVLTGDEVPLLRRLTTGKENVGVEKLVAGLTSSVFAFKLA